MIKQFESAVGLIELDYFRKRDISAQLDYLYESSGDFLEEIGFDTSKLPGRDKHGVFLLKSLESEERSGKVVARVRGMTIACVYLDQRGESPKAHFHIYNSTYRGKGVGSLVFRSALKILMLDHNISELTVEPKVSNLPMNKMLQKCGFKNLGASIYKSPVTQEFESYKYLVHLDEL